MNDAAPHVVIVDPYSSGAGLAPAFRGRGAVPVAVLSTPRPPDPYAATWRPDLHPDAVVADGDPARLAERLRAYRPAAVLAGTECGVELADALAATLTPDRANVPRLAAARRHKARMQEALAAAGLRHIRQVCTADEDAVAEWLSDASPATGVVLKPPKSAGTDGVVRVPPGGDWRTPFRRMLGRRDRLGGLNDEVLVQEFVTGVEFAVDTVSVDGRHTVNAVSRYAKVSTEDRVAVYDALRIVPYDHPGNADLVEYVAAALDAIGIRNGPAHSEVMRTPTGPVLIESAARMHGGRHPDHCLLATGDSQIRRTVAAALDRSLPRTDYDLHRHVAVVFIVAHRSGVVGDHRLLDALTELPAYVRMSVDVPSGQRVEPTRDLFGILGRILLCHDSADQLRADLAAARHIAARLVGGEHR